MKSISSRIQELEVSHERGRNVSESGTPGGSSRHVSRIERSPAHPMMQHQSVSLVVTSPNSQVQQSARSKASVPNTAPVDLNQFMFNERLSTDIPQINCRTHSPHAGAVITPNAGRLQQQINFPSSVIQTSTNSAEPRRPVKVININAGHGSGGFVKPAAVPTNSRHFRMHFGDSGGVVTVPRMERSESTPNIGHQYRTEIRAEPSVPQSNHSSTLVFNTINSHSNNTSPQRRIIDTTKDRRPPLHLNTSPSEIGQGAPAFISNNTLSKPIQASSPGVSSKPLFVELKNDEPFNLYLNNNCSRPVPQPSSTNFGSHSNLSYHPQNQHVFTQYPGSHPTQMEPFAPGSMFAHSSGYGYPTSSTQSYSPISNTVDVGGRLSCQNQMNFAGNYPSPQIAPYQQGHHKTPSPGIGHMNMSPAMMGSRSNSQDSSEHSYSASDHSFGASPELMDTRPFSGRMGPRVSSQTNVNDLSAQSEFERIQQIKRARSNSMQERQEEADYNKGKLKRFVLMCVIIRVF